MFRFAPLIRSTIPLTKSVRYETTAAINAVEEVAKKKKGPKGPRKVKATEPEKEAIVEKQKREIVANDAKKAYGKSDIVELLHQSDFSDLSESKLGRILTSFIGTISNLTMVQGKRVQFAKFGSFEKKDVKATRKKNIQTKDFYVTEASTKLRFKPSKTMRGEKEEKQV